MNQTDRHNAPYSEEVKDIAIIEGKTHRLSSGVDLHYISAGTAEVLRLDLVFDAGTRVQEHNAVAVAASHMLTEGTQKKSAEQIAEELDFYGSYFQTKCSADDGTVTLYCLKKHFGSCLPYILDVIEHSIFPQHELEIYKKNAIQRLMVNKQRNSFLARRIFYSSLFGATHPYGIFSEAIDYENISRENLSQFFSKQYKKGIKYIMLSGAVNESVISLCDNLLSAYPSSFEANTPLLPWINPAEKIFFEKTDSIQSAIRIGRKLFNRTHPDFQKLQVLNLVLGGYFGSRLMKNIREEKGLTYGIYSVLESYRDSGCFFVETEINNDLRDTGIAEIYKEIALLRTELIDETELKVAKNYLLGSFLRSIDGPFSLADRHKILVDFGLGYDYYYRFIEIVNNITARELRELANTYLQPNDLSEIIVGKR